MLSYKPELCQVCFRETRKCWSSRNTRFSFMMILMGKKCQSDISLYHCTGKLFNKSEWNMSLLSQCSPAPQSWTIWTKEKTLTYSVALQKPSEEILILSQTLILPPSSEPEDFQTQNLLHHFRLFSSLGQC